MRAWDAMGRTVDICKLQYDGHKPRSHHGQRSRCTIRSVVVEREFNVEQRCDMCEGLQCSDNLRSVRRDAKRICPSDTEAAAVLRRAKLVQPLDLLVAVSAAGEAGHRNAPWPLQEGAGRID